MKKYLTLASSFVIMLCIGSVYAWSLVASELIDEYRFSALETQVIFGALIGIFPVTMIFVGNISEKIKHRYFGYIAGALFLVGYYLAGHSQGSFVPVFVGVGVLAGIGTGFGYWTALTVPVLWFPKNRGLATGIAAAGFGLGAIFMSELFEILFRSGYNVLQLLKIIGVVYGLIIIAASSFIFQVHEIPKRENTQIGTSYFLRLTVFRRLFSGMFLGTFAGLLIVGSIGVIGGQHQITGSALVLGVVFFSAANFFGRLFWGGVSDYFETKLCIFLALLLQSLSILSLNVFLLTDISYLIIAALIGFGFGGNFVLFAKETTQAYGTESMGVIYPYVFVGYAIAGILGPLSGGFIYDFFGTFYYAVFLAGFMSLVGSLLFLNQFFTSKKNE
ncbi:MAG: MFS transporter [Salinivirgaceae bacterium]